ncbi:hypothetical protein GCM10009610_48260 [Pseudonocardia xinjiangensis]
MTEPARRDDRHREEERESTADDYHAGPAGSAGYHVNITIVTITQFAVPTAIDGLVIRSLSLAFLCPCLARGPPHPHRLPVPVPRLPAVTGKTPGVPSEFPGSGIH